MVLVAMVAVVSFLQYFSLSLACSFYLFFWRHIFNWFSFEEGDDLFFLLLMCSRLWTDDLTDTESMKQWNITIIMMIGHDRLERQAIILTLTCARSLLPPKKKLPSSHRILKAVSYFGCYYCYYSLSCRLGCRNDDPQWRVSESHFCNYRGGLRHDEGETGNG